MSDSEGVSMHVFFILHIDLFDLQKITYFRQSGKHNSRNLKISEIWINITNTFRRIKNIFNVSKLR